MDFEKICELVDNNRSKLVQLMKLHKSLSSEDMNDDQALMMISDWSKNNGGYSMFADLSAIMVGMSVVLMLGPDDCDDPALARSLVSVFMEDMHKRLAELMEED